MFETKTIEPEIVNAFARWRAPGGWNLFAREVLRVDLDPEQQAILDSVQMNPLTSVVSGTSRGKDFVSAVAAVCFMYLTPVWDEHGEMVENTKVVMTAPTGRQVNDIMFAEVSRIFRKARCLPGRLTGNDIRTEFDEWFLTGFKADSHTTEAWTGMHAANILFVVTEASGIPQAIWDAIEGNLQGNSRLLIVFNANVPFGYAAQSQKSARWAKFRLNSLNAPNVLQRKKIIPGQVDYDWVWDKVNEWCTPVPEEDVKQSMADFQFAGPDNVIRWYRPNDLFRIKVLGLFPTVSEGALIPLEWIQQANERWKEIKALRNEPNVPLRLGADVAGMGRDCSCFCHRYGKLVERFDLVHAGGKADHMRDAGRIVNIFNQTTDVFTGRYPQVFIDTIGEGAGVYSRLIELASGVPAPTFKANHIHSVKFSEGGTWNEEPLKDITGQYTFLNMRAYLFWAVRDWLNPDNKTGAALPPDDGFAQEATEIQWRFRSDGKIQIEDKEEIKKRLKRSTDKFDALANTFYPVPDIDVTPKKRKNIAGLFH
jgi:hypothetical protein